MENDTLFPSAEKIRELKEKQGEELISLLAGFDAQGLLLGPEETADQFADRLLTEANNIEKLRAELMDRKEAEPLIGLRLKAGSEIPEEIMEEGAAITREHYGFEIKWVPGFFPSSGLGLLWGGCSISSSEDTPTLFLIRESFRKKKKFFVYDRKELIAHELCHAARVPINDMVYEEHFAYALSDSALRRYSGNCFKSEKDAILFILPIFLLLLIQIMRVSYTPDLPSWPFWILAFVWPVFLIVINILERRTYFAAEQALILQKTARPNAVLFRCTAQEIREFAACMKAPSPEEASAKLLEKKISSDLRWQVIAKRFIRPETADAP